MEKTGNILQWGCDIIGWNWGSVEVSHREKGGKDITTGVLH